MLRFSATFALFVLVIFSTVAILPARCFNNASVDAKDGTALEVQTFSLINQYRLAHDLPALVWDGAITKVARAHSKDMAVGDVDFGHEGFSSRISHLKSVMPGLQGAGENVLMTDDPTEAAHRAVDLWLHSPHHLENIRGNYNYSGLGVWTNAKGEIYFTQIFVKLVPPSQETESAPQTGIITSFGLLATPRARSSP